LFIIGPTTPIVALAVHLTPKQISMPEPYVKVREVAWNELCPWLILVRSVRIALMARVLFLGALGLAATAAGWLLIARLTSGIDDPVLDEWRHRSVPFGIAEEPREFWVNTSAESAIEVFESARQGLIQAPKEIWQYLTRPFTLMFSGGLSARGFLILLICEIWELFVWGLFGGAITRIAALKFTRDEAPGFFAALKHAVGKWPSYSLPPLIALAGASLFAIQLVGLGLLMRIPGIPFVVAIIWPFVIILGLMMAILLLGALVGWPFMWATVSVEGTDAFDALSRSYAYTYHRPWRLLWYVVFAAILAVVSMFVVKLFATSAIKLGNWSIAWGLDDWTVNNVVAPEHLERDTATLAPPAVVVPPADGSPTPSAPVAEAATPPAAGLSPMNEGARRLIAFWKYAVSAIAAGYQVGFLFVAAVGIYLLLRRDIDGVQLNEVYIDQSDEYGMPPLSEDMATGVPEVASGQPALPGDTGAPA
jgi:hypothetical protein